MSQSPNGSLAMDLPVKMMSQHVLGDQLSCFDSLFL